MSFKTVDMDNKEQYNEYKKKKNHAKFMKENANRKEVVDPESVKEETPVVEETKEPEEKIEQKLCAKVVKIDQLRVRNYPEGDIIKLISKGTEVEIISDVNDCWYKVRLKDGTVGYCMKTYLLTYMNGEAHGLNDSRRCKTWPTTL